MFSKRWMMVAAFGYGVLFSLALTGGVRIACLLLGVTLSEHAAGNLFFFSSLLTGSLSALLYGRFLKGSQAKAKSDVPSRS